MTTRLWRLESSRAGYCKAQLKPQGKIAGRVFGAAAFEALAFFLCAGGVGGMNVDNAESAINQRTGTPDRSLVICKDEAARQAARDVCLARPHLKPWRFFCAGRWGGRSEK